MIAVQRLHLRPEIPVTSFRRRIVPHLRTVSVTGERKDVGKGSVHHSKSRRIDSAFLKRYPEIDRESRRMHEGVEVWPQRRQPMWRRWNASHAPRTGVGTDLISATAKHVAQQIKMALGEQDVRVHRHPQLA